MSATWLSCRDETHFITEEAVEYSFTESLVDFHEVCQPVKVLSVWNPVWQLCFVYPFAWIVKAEEAALLRKRKREPKQSHWLFFLILSFTCNVWSIIKSVHPAGFGPLGGGISRLLHDIFPIAAKCNFPPPQICRQKGGNGLCQVKKNKKKHTRLCVIKSKPLFC